MCIVGITVGDGPAPIVADTIIVGTLFTKTTPPPFLNHNGAATGLLNAFRLLAWVQLNTVLSESSSIYDTTVYGAVSFRRADTTTATFDYTLHVRACFVWAVRPLVVLYRRMDMATATLEIICTCAREGGRWGVVVSAGLFDGDVERIVT